MILLRHSAELNRMVGSVALYNFTGKTAEIGKSRLEILKRMGVGLDVKVW